MYVAVEGCIGSGKTTVSRLLVDKRNSSLILEDSQANPFLDKFYSNPPRYAFETELAFVLIHYHQISNEMQLHESNDYIADFCISKDLLFAKMNLNDNDLALFKNLYFPLAKRLPEPDIMICLKCSDELILERIKQRGQGSEHCIDPEYFLDLNKRYDAYFTEIKTAKIEVNMDEVDFINHSENIIWLSNEINELLISGD
ncbi:deoxynucleoside kinase [Candidatus Pacearchaeota archaeon]|nr:deoxynucleoside kinase [Candidatus Pacearchaeota archaeon]